MKENQDKKTKELTVKKDEKKIDNDQLDKIEKELNDSKKKSKLTVVNEKRYGIVLRNIVVGILFTIYFGLILLGKEKIPAIEYIIDLKTFIIFDLLVTLVLLEIAYKKENEEIALHGVEMATVGGLTIWTLDLFSRQNIDLNVYISVFICIVVFYYLVKSVIMALKKKRKST